MRVATAAAFALLVAALAAPSGAAGAARASQCATTTPASALGGAAGLRALNAKEWSYGPRPTGSRAQQQMVAWLERELRAVPQLRVTDERFRVTRWVAERVGLTLKTGSATTELPVAAPVPASALTGAAGATAQLVYVPAGQAIGAADVAGRIVVRDAPAGSVPLAVFTPALLAYDTYDPARTLTVPGATFAGDFLNYDARVHDLRDAAQARAAGVVFLKDLPREQLAGHDEPYEGTAWGVPAVFLGADESQRVRDALTAGGELSATLTLTARRTKVVTRSVFATLSGRSAERVVIDSHTDGTNAVEDNGPVAMLAMARHLATLPRTCRPRSYQFVFATGHFYQHIASSRQRHGGSGVVAARLDRAYDHGGVAGVMVLEHLGAREYAAVPRAAGAGTQLRLSGRAELQQVLVTPSKPLRAAVRRVVIGRRLDRTAMLTAADVADPERAPEHCSFGGEGTPYNQRLLPTVAVISAPMTLYDPAFGLEGIDFDRMNRQALAFTDLAVQMGRMSRKAIAGDVVRERVRRRGGAPGCPADI